LPAVIEFVVIDMVNGFSSRESKDLAMHCDPAASAHVSALLVPIPL
jgi:hypothetical protein